MSSFFEYLKRPLVQSLIVFVVLFIALVILAGTFDFSGVDIGGLLFLVSFICCALVAKSIYDTALMQNKIIELGAQLTDDISVSSQELYTELYQNSPVPYMLIDYAGHISSANLAACRLLNMPQSKVKGINIFEYLKSDSEDHLDLLIEKYKNKIPVGDETVKVIRVGGGEGWALLSLFYFTNYSNEHLGMLTLVDITRQKQVENAKSEFVSLASHQLRTPIAGIKWSAELLELDAGDSLTPKQKRYVERLLIGVNRMAVLVDDFLRVSRFELGTFQPEFTTVDLPNVIDSIVAEQTPRAIQKRIDTKTFYDETVRKVVTDGNLVRMIISNLYSNAIKYTREEGTVHIGYTQKDDTIHISVADNGMGIPVVEQEYVFSKLFRATNAVRNVPDGTGLGLYIAKEAVDVLKGKITFTSVENSGATFEIVLPLTVSEEN